MEKKVFRTCLKGDHKFGKNKYIRGRVSGMSQIICEEEIVKGYAWGINRETGDAIHTIEATEEQYERFSKIVEELYPGLCIFDYKVEGKVS